MDYDVIVVGARVAGAATSMLLARAGLRVLTVDRVTFPSDTVSSHQVQVPGVALLHQWGLLERLRAVGTPPTRRVRFDPGNVVLEGAFPSLEGVDTLYSPRRIVLDAALIAAAREAGTEVIEGARVEELVSDSRDRVCGVRVAARDGRTLHATATLVIGADGKHSFVADRVRARRYRRRPVRAFACYGYFAGLPATVGELYQRPNRSVAVFPTNDELTMVYIAGPIAEFESFRRDIEQSYLRTLDGCGDLGQRARSAVRVERLRTTPDQPNMFRTASGPGWALVGDAGVVMDSITAQGIANALRDADRLAKGIVAGIGGAAPLDRALVASGRLRDRQIVRMYDFTTQLAKFRPPNALGRQFFRSVHDRPGEVDRFLGAFAGITPIDRYFSMRNAAHIVGARGIVTALARPGTAAKVAPHGDPGLAA
jgi:2-polyprenyl-6-methoxyphenol hydroxylase-like FAD-dependent oxidoreductase